MEKILLFIAHKILSQLSVDERKEFLLYWLGKCGINIAPEPIEKVNTSKPVADFPDNKDKIKSVFYPVHLLNYLFLFPWTYKKIEKDLSRFVLEYDFTDVNIEILIKLFNQRQWNQLLIEVKKQTEVFTYTLKDADKTIIDSFGSNIIFLPFGTGEYPSESDEIFFKRTEKEEAEKYTDILHNFHAASLKYLNNIEETDIDDSNILNAISNEEFKRVYDFICNYRYDLQHDTIRDHFELEVNKYFEEEKSGLAAKILMAKFSNFDLKFKKDLVHFPYERLSRKMDKHFIHPDIENEILSILNGQPEIIDKIKQSEIKFSDDGVLTLKDELDNPETKNILYTIDKCFLFDPLLLDQKTWDNLQYIDGFNSENENLKQCAKQFTKVAFYANKTMDKTEKIINEYNKININLLKHLNNEQN